MVFKILQAQIHSEVKKEIEKSLSDDQLETIIVPVEYLDYVISWTRKGKEFIYNKKMYDVVRKKENSGNVIFYCLNDEKEEKLFANLDQLTTKNNSHNKRLKNILTSKITNYYCEEYGIYNSAFKSESLKPWNTHSYKIIDKEIESPPPKLS